MCERVLVGARIENRVPHAPIPSPYTHVNEDQRGLLRRESEIDSKSEREGEERRRERKRGNTTTDHSKQVR